MASEHLNDRFLTEASWRGSRGSTEVAKLEYYTINNVSYLGWDLDLLGIRREYLRNLGVHQTKRLKTIDLTNINYSKVVFKNALAYLLRL